MTAIQFGIMLVFNLCIGTITPPVGNILFVGVRVAKTSIERVIKPLLPYYGVIILVLLLVTFVPANLNVFTETYGILNLYKFNFRIVCPVHCE